MDPKNAIPSTFCLEQTDWMWREVSNAIGRFLKAWQESTDDPPVLRNFLPTENDAVRQIALVELIKLDMEERSQSEHSFKPVREYAVEFPDLESPDGFPCDLLYEEFHIRRPDEQITIRSFAEDYPTQKDELLRLLGQGAEFETTAMFRTRCPVELKPGDVVSDFELLTKLGEGAFAAVYLARQHSMQRLVAVKLSSDHGREPQTLAKLDHPNIVRVYDQRTDEERGLRVLYMQYLPAGTLQGVLQRMSGLDQQQWSGATLLDAVDSVLEDRGLQPPDDSQQRERLGEAAWWEAVCIVAQQLAEALAYAHKNGVLHRDIKPANILLSASASPKLADFNVSSCSKVHGASPAAYFGGSLAYMSPEQLEASNPRSQRSPDDLDARSDLYSLAIVVWEMLSGQRPFATGQNAVCRSNVLEVLHEQRVEGLQPEDRDQFPVDCPDGLKEVLTKCLSLDPDDRYTDARQLADRLRLCLNPAAERLLTRSSVLRQISCRFPVLFVTMSLMIPNALAGLFNYVYNYESIIRPMGANEVFRVVQLSVNGIAFPMGLIVCIVLAWQVGRVVRDRQLISPQAIADDVTRHRGLRLGNRLAWLGIIEWSIAGVVYPVALSLGGAPLDATGAVHFFGSLLICGLIAATYPFFGTTVIVLDAWYPLLLRPEGVPKIDLVPLERLERLCWRYLIVAGTIPLLALMVLSTWGRAENRLALIVLSAGGLALFAGVFLLARSIQDRLRLMCDLARQRIGRG